MIYHVMICLFIFVRICHFCKLSTNLRVGGMHLRKPAKTRIFQHRKKNLNWKFGTNVQSMYYQSCSNFWFLLSHVLLGLHTLFVLHHRGYVHRYLSMYKCPMITLIPPPHHPLCLFVCRASMINRGLGIVLFDSAYKPTTHGKPLWCKMFAHTVHPLLHNRDRLHSSHSSGTMVE